MVEGGIRDIFIVNQIVTEAIIARLCTLAKRATLRVAIDDEDNLRALSAAAERYGVNIGVLIEVATSGRRSGIRPGHQGGIEKGVELAQLAQGLPAITFRGVQSHQTLPGKPDPESRRAEALPFFQMCLDVRDAIEAAGIPVDVVSSGETFSYGLCGHHSGVTEVEGGTYMLMAHTFDYMTEFKIAAKVLGTVISTPRAGVAIGDVGARAMGLRVPPAVEGMPGVTVAACTRSISCCRCRSPPGLRSATSSCSAAATRTLRPTDGLVHRGARRRRRDGLAYRGERLLPLNTAVSPPSTSR